MKLRLLKLAVIISISSAIVNFKQDVSYANNTNKEELSSLINTQRNDVTDDKSEIQINYKNLQSDLGKINITNNSTNPNNYELITNNIDDMVTLMDRYGQLHGIVYNGNSYLDDKFEKISFTYACTNKYIKSDYIITEIYKENNGSLSMQKSGYWDLGSTDKKIVSFPIERDLYKNQPYLYFKMGVSDSLTGYYEDYKLVKIKNPFFVNDSDTTGVNDINGHWAEKTIKTFIEKGYINGYDDKTFKPNNSITRAEFVKIFNKYFGLTKSSGKTFNDTQTHWAKNEIDIAVTNGVANGISELEFRPNEPITREQAAKMISNYMKLNDSNHDKIEKYSDKNKISAWAVDSVEGMVEKGYMNGYDDNTFKPGNPITRAEAVVTLSRIK